MVDDSTVIKHSSDLEPQGYLSNPKIFRKFMLTEKRVSRTKRNVVMNPLKIFRKSAENFSHRLSET